MTTNISDLPGGNSNVPNIQLHTREKTGSQKVPLSSINEMVGGLQKAANNNMTTLPIRDVPHDPERITRDPQIQPNYVPPPPNQNYIEDEMEYEEMMRRNQNEYQQKERMDSLYDEIQQPVIVSILFFLFQLPFFNKTLLKFVPTLFKADGHPKFMGYLLKTFMFGITIFLANKGFDMISEF
tara:strand:- start:3122 stop:3667 length:546 start_codon:yes stop_codon:yes gene_type:complete